MLALIAATILAAQPPVAGADPVQWMKQRALVRLKLYCEARPYGQGGASVAPVLCTVGSGSIVSPKAVLTAQHVIEQGQSRVAEVEICRSDALGGCLPRIAVSTISAAVWSKPGAEGELITHDVALLHFDKQLLTDSEAAVWRQHAAQFPLKAYAAAQDDAITALGTAYYVTDQNQADFKRPFEAESIQSRVASFQGRVPAKMFATELWKDATATHEVLRTCEPGLDVSPGYSGGPVVDMKGQLVGVITGWVGGSFYASPTHRAMFAKPGGDGTRCLFSTIISLFPAPWPDDPFSDTFLGMKWVHFGDVSAKSSNLNRSKAVSFTAAEAHLLSNIEGPLILSLGSSSERLAKYFRRVLQTEDETRRQLRVRLRCSVDHDDGSCREATFARENYPPLQDPQYETGDDDNANVAVALEIISTLRSLWKAHRQIETLVEAMRSLDETFGLATLRVEGPWALPKAPAAGANQLQPPDCELAAEDVSTTPMESLFQDKLGVSLDEPLAKLLTNPAMTQIRTAYQALEQGPLPSSAAILSQLRRAFLAADRRIGAASDRFGWPATMKISLQDLPLKCYRDFPRLQRLAWATFARAGIVPFKTLSLKDVSDLVRATSVPDTDALLGLTRSNGALEQLAKMSAGNSDAHLTAARVSAIDLRTNPLLGSMSGSASLEEYLARTYETGEGRAAWQVILDDIEKLECNANALVASSVGSTPITCEAVSRAP